MTALNGAHYRQRFVADVVREFKLIREKHVLVVDDNLIGTRHEHIARAKYLFRAMAQANLRKQWVAQAGINFDDKEELLALAAKAGCIGVFIGFETPHTGRTAGTRQKIQPSEGPGLLHLHAAHPAAQHIGRGFLYHWFGH